MTKPRYGEGAPEGRAGTVERERGLNLVLVSTFAVISVCGYAFLLSSAYHRYLRWLRQPKKASYFLD